MKNPASNIQYSRHKTQDSRLKTEEGKESRRAGRTAFLRFCLVSCVLRLASFLCLVSFLLLCFCAGSWSAEDMITTLQKQISALEEQKGQLEAEKQTLIAEGDELSLKIEALKIQAKGGLGIIGRYRLSRNLRKAQALSEKIQNLEKEIQKAENDLRDKTDDLEREYEHQIAALLEKLNGISQAEERGDILEKVREYQAAKEHLARSKEVRELEPLDITKIEIKEYDGPREIREKADLINDYAGKLSDGIKMLNDRVRKLKEELKTRSRLGEFAEEISFFGERIAKEEIVSDSGKEPIETPTEKSDEGNVPVETSTFTRDTDTATPITTEPPAITATEPPATTSTEPPVTTVTQPPTSGGMLIERNGVSADFVGTPLNQIEAEIKLLEKRRQDLEKELSMLSEKASSFYKKADEIEKSEIETGERKR